MTSKGAKAFAVGVAVAAAGALVAEALRNWWRNRSAQ